VHRENAISNDVGTGNHMNKLWSA